MVSSAAMADDLDQRVLAQAIDDIVASFLPFIVRIVILMLNGMSPFANLGYIFVPGGIINAIFVYALIGLLLHSQSREYQKIWFN